MTPKTTMSELTDERVVQVLTKRLGMVPLDKAKMNGVLWHPIHERTYLIPNSPVHKERQRMGVASHKPFLLDDLLNSRDALDPVLRGLSPLEKRDLLRLLRDKYYSDHLNTEQFTSIDGLFWLLTLPPADLARAIASVVKEGK